MIFVGSILRSALLAVLGVIPAHAQQQVVAFTHVAVVPMDRDRVLIDQTVVVRGDRIVDMGNTKDVAIPSGATRIDGRGKYLLPGLADMHTHVPGLRRLLKARIYTHPESVTLSDDDITEAERLLQLNLAHGVTTVRVMYGHSKLLGLRDRIANGELLAPRMFVSSPSLFPAYSPRAAAALVERAKVDGYDFIKMYNGGEAWDSAVAAARRVGMPIAGHAPQRLPSGSDSLAIILAMQAGYRSIEHLTGFANYLTGNINTTDLTGNTVTAPALDSAAVRTLAEAMRHADVWNCPTIGPVTVSDEDWRLVSRYFVDSFRRRVDAQRKEEKKSKRDTRDQSDNGESSVTPFTAAVIKALRDAGAGLLLGTDAFGIRVPGFVVHHELAALVEAGLTPYEALVTGTRGAAQFLGTIDSAGTVSVGKRADLILLNENPLHTLKSVRHPTGVMLGGRWLDRKALDAMLQAIEGTLEG